ncbi:MAG TPA: hypothetical protein VHT91_39420 [Kofleriaceae bacterium]|nr:hypothetical protein [Kofleriaceae bacterium]
MLARDGGLEPDNTRSKEILQAQMSALIALPGGAVALVARYGADPRGAVIRPLAFLLGTAVNDRAAAHALATTVFAMIAQLAIDDPWPRLNLCTAVQRLLMFGAVDALAPPAAAALAKLLRESLAGIPPLRATAATVVADLFYRRRTDLLADTDLATLRTTLLGLVDDPDELTRNEARGFRELLSKPPSQGTD